jgi:hypothetical protein
MLHRDIEKNSLRPISVNDTAPDGRILAITGMGDNSESLTLINNWRAAK